MPIVGLVLAYVAVVGVGAVALVGPAGPRRPQRVVTAVVLAAAAVLAPGLALVEANRRSEGLFCDVDATCAAPSAGPALALGLVALVVAVTATLAGVVARWPAARTMVVGGVAVTVLLAAVVVGVQYDVVVPRP